MSTLERVKRGFTGMLVANGVRMVSKGLIVFLLASVFLGPDEYGLLFFAIAVLQVALLFSYLGLGRSGARYLAEYRETRPGQVPHVMRTVLRYNLVTIVVVVAVLVAFADRIATALGEPRLTPFLVVGAGYVVVKTLREFVVMSFQGFNRADWSGAVSAVSSISLLGFVVLFLLLGFGALGALGGYVAGIGVAVLVGAAVLYRRFYTRHDPDPEPDEGLSRRVLRYSVPLTVTRGAHSLDREVDTVLVGYFLTSAAVGYYTLGKQIADFVIAPASSLGFAISPSYGEQKAKENIDAAARMYETSLIYTVLWYLPAAVGLILLAEPVVVLVFGEAYLGAVPVVAVFGVYVLLRAIDKITNDGLDFLGRARARAIAKSGASIANFGLNLVLIPTVGVLGAAVATVVTQGLLTAVELYIVHRELVLDLRRLGRATVAICAVTGGMAASIVWLVPYIAGLPSLFGLVGLGVAVWAVLALGSGLVELSQIRSFLGRTDERPAGGTDE